MTTWPSFLKCSFHHYISHFIGPVECSGKQPLDFIPLSFVPSQAKAVSPSNCQCISLICKLSSLNCLAFLCPVQIVSVLSLGCKLLSLSSLTFLRPVQAKLCIVLECRAQAISTHIADALSHLPVVQLQLSHFLAPVRLRLNCALCIFSRPIGQANNFNALSHLPPATCHAQLKLFPHLIIILSFFLEFYHNLIQLHRLTPQCPVHIVSPTSAQASGGRGGRTIKLGTEFQIKFRPREPLVLNPEKTLQNLSAWLV